MITAMMGVIIVIIILLLMMILVLKMTNKYTHNMILMSRYKGKRVKKSRQGSPPSLSGNARKKTSFYGRCSLKVHQRYSLNAAFKYFGTKYDDSKTVLKNARVFFAGSDGPS